MFTIFNTFNDFLEAYFNRNQGTFIFAILLCSMLTLAALWFLGTNTEKNHEEIKKKIDGSWY